MQYSGWESLSSSVLGEAWSMDKQLVISWVHHGCFNIWESHMEKKQRKVFLKKHATEFVLPLFYIKIKHSTFWKLRCGQISGGEARIWNEDALKLVQ